MNSLIEIWKHGDLVTYSVAIILLIMSITSWSVIVVGWLRNIEFVRQQRNASDFWDAPSLNEFVNRFLDDSSPWKQLTLEGQYAAKGYESRASDQNDLNAKAEWIAKSLSTVTDKFAFSRNYGLNLLSSVGATAPFVGLLGTVWGIYNTLLVLGSSSRQMTIDQVASPIGEALIMTAFGLAVAIPAVLGNNSLIGYNRKHLEILDTFVKELQVFFTTGQRPLKYFNR